MSGYIVEKPAPHVVEHLASNSMYEALMMLDGARHIGSNYSASMHPRTHHEWKALINIALEQAGYGCVQRHCIQASTDGRPALFTTKIFIHIEDAVKESIRHIDVFDWR